ncbi:hypothetical protein GC209_15475 [bacterium]|nr:hypothetical protein [bacterium]
MIEGLAPRLAELAAAGRTVTYGALARDLGLTGPATIARLTAALEATMEEDAAQGQPFRAAVLSGRLAQDLPAQGFFDRAAALGRDVCAPQAFIAAERAALRLRFG